MSNDDWPGGFVSASTLSEAESEQEDEGDVTLFNEHGVRYCSGGERSQEYLYMENMPPEMENKC